MTCYRLDRAVVVKFSAPVETGPGIHPAPYIVITRLFPGVKCLGRGINYPPPSSTKVKQRVELCLYSHLSSIMAACRVKSHMTEVTALMKPWKLLQCDIFCVIVFVTLRCNTLALGDRSPMFRDSMLVSSSRVKVFSDWTVQPLKIRPPCCLTRASITH